MWYADFASLAGKTLTNVENTGYEVIFTADDGSQFKLYHDQDCCESVYVEDVAGDLADLIGAPILMAEEASSLDGHSGAPLSEWDESYTWTYYKLATIKGSVDIRFYGSSNGYYSESVSFAKVS